MDQSRDRGDGTPLWLLLSAMGTGILFGLLQYPPIEHRGIDGSLVLAGIVHYPPHSVMAQYYYGSWTLIHQLGALLLLAGISQAAVNVFFSLVAYAILVGAFAMIIDGFCRRPVFALVAASFCFLTNPLSDLLVSPDYPTLGAKWEWTAGTPGLWSGAGAAWVIGALAGGRNGLAGFSAAVLVAIHPVVGAYVVSLLCALVVLGRLFGDLKTDGIGRGLVLGALVTAASFAVYLLLRPPQSGDVDLTAYQNYMTYWDFHRNRAMAALVSTKMTVLAVLQVLVLAAFLRLSRTTRASAFLAAVALLVAVIASTLAYFAVHLVPAALPQQVIVVIPGRLLNVQAYVWTAVAVGLAVWALDQVLLAPADTLRYRVGIAVRRLETKLAYPLGRRHRYEGTASDTPLVRGFLFAAVVAALASYNFPARPLAGAFLRALHVKNYISWQAESGDFWRQVRTAGVRGLVLTPAEASRDAIRYGHLAVLLDVTGFDFVPYLPHTVRDVARIIEIGYGISFGNPPLGLRFQAALWEGTKPYEGVQRYWERLTAEDWRRVARDLEIEGVVAPSEWKMRLPIIVAGSRLTFYRIAATK